MKGLDGRACFGLVLAICGLRAIVEPLASLVQLQMLSRISVIESLPIAVPAFVAGLQIATGCAFAFGKTRAGWACLAGYAAVSAGVTIFGLVELDIGGPALAAVVVETFGVPAVALVVLRFVRRPGSDARSEAGVLLVLLAISGFVHVAIYAVEAARRLWFSFGLLAGEGLLVAFWLTIALFQLRAGLQLRRGAATAERAVKAYVIAVIAVQGAELLLLTVLGFDDGTSFLHAVLPVRIVAAMGYIAVAFLLWAFVRGHRPVPASRVPTTPAWYALVFVPYLAARPLIADAAISPVLGIELAIVIATAFAAQAIATGLAARASLTEQLSAARHALVATITGLATTSVFVVIMQRHDSRSDPGVLGSLVVATAVMAWLHRTATSPVPRAIAKQV